MRGRPPPTADIPRRSASRRCLAQLARRPNFRGKRCAGTGCIARLRRAVKSAQGCSRSFRPQSLDVSKPQQRSFSVAGADRRLHPGDRSPVAENARPQVGPAATSRRNGPRSIPMLASTSQSCCSNAAGKRIRVQLLVLKIRSGFRPPHPRDWKACEFRNVVIRWANECGDLRPRLSWRQRSRRWSSRARTTCRPAQRCALPMCRPAARHGARHPRNATGRYGPWRHARCAD